MDPEDLRESDRETLIAIIIRLEKQISNIKMMKDEWKRRYFVLSDGLKALVPK